MYFISNLGALLFLCFSAVLGCALGVFFDLLRTVRRFVRKPKILTFVLDIIFFIVSAVVAYLYMLIASNGQVRLFVLGGMFSGFLLYRWTVSLYVYRAMVFSVRLISGTIGKILTPILKFAGKTGKIILNKLNFPDKIKKLKVFIKKHLKNIFAVVYTKRRKYEERKDFRDVKESENQISLVEKYFD